MGTRGTYGFRKNGEDKLTYNHYDSYPSWLGVNMLQFAIDCTIQELNDIYDRLVLVDEESEPTPEQIEECKKYADTGVSSGSLKDWYCLLRKTQGEPTAYKEGLKYMIDNSGFIKDSLFCEYGYIINLDTCMFEFWSGFQKVPQEGNRYGETSDDDRYYPCKLLLEIPLAELELMDVDELAEKMQASSKADYEQQEQQVNN